MTLRSPGFHCLSCRTILYLVKRFFLYTKIPPLTSGMLPLTHPCMSWYAGLLSQQSLHAYDLPDQASSISRWIPDSSDSVTTTLHQIELQECRFSSALGNGLELLCFAKTKELVAESATVESCDLYKDP